MKLNEDYEIIINTVTKEFRTFLTKPLLTKK